MPKSPMPFFWYELMTTDLDAAETFYTKVVGWTAQPFDKAPGMPRYIVMNVGERGVGGLMTMPEDAAKMGMPPAWLGYIHTKDVDASTKALKAAGGAVHREPDDIPGVGRFAVVADPQGATFMFLQPAAPTSPSCKPAHLAISAGTSSIRAIGRPRSISIPASSAGPMPVISTWARWAPTRHSRPAPNPAAAS